MKICRIALGLAFIGFCFVAGCAKDDTSPDVLLITIEAQSLHSLTNSMTPTLSHFAATNAWSSSSPGQFAKAFTANGNRAGAFLADGQTDNARGFTTVDVSAEIKYFPMQFRPFPEREAAQVRRADATVAAAKAWVGKQPQSKPLLVWLQFRDLVFSGTSHGTAADESLALSPQAVEAAYLDLQVAQFKEFMTQQRGKRDMHVYLFVVPNVKFEEQLENDIAAFLQAYPVDSVEAKERRLESVLLWRELAYYFYNRTLPQETTDLVAATQRLILDYPSHTPFHTWLGILLASEGKMEEALDQFKTAVALSPQSPYVLSNMGIAYWNLRDFPKSIDKLEDAFLLQQDSEFRDNLAFVLMNVGVALSAQGEYNDALACLSRVTLLQPNNPLAFFNMGVVFQSMGNADFAESNFRKALDIAPKFEPARQALKRMEK